MNRNNIYTVNPLYNGSTTQSTEDGSVQSGGTTIIYQQGGGTGLTDAQKQKLDGIQEGAEVNQNAYSKVRLNGSDALIVEAKNKTDILNMSGVYPIAIAINDNGGLDFTVSSDQSNTNSVVTQAQLKAALDQLEKDQYWKVDADGKLYTELDVYSHKEISAYGAGTGGGGTGGAGALYECADVLRDGDKVKGAEVGSVLSYNGTHWYAIPQSAIVPDLSGYATKSYVSQEINDLIGGAPGTLDTLKEIAEALGNDPNFATTITNMINNIGLRVDDIEARVVSLEDMFEWDKSASASDPSLWRIKAKKDLYGVGEISAYGYSSGTVPTGAQYMYELKDVLFTELTSGQLLQWNGTKWINIDKNAVGLNESELAKYLTTNNYAKKADITWANLLNKPTTWAWADITGKPTTLAGYGITDGVPNTRRVSAGSGLSGGGTLSSNVTISLGTIGTAGTYTKVTTDMYGRVVSGTTLSEGDIPTLQISKISGLQTALDSKLNISDFSTWFTINKNASGQVISIQANFDFFGVGEISAYGLGETQPSVTTLAGLDDVTITSPANGQTLIYDSATSQWKNGTIIGGGNISLNGTVYKPVNGTITLPNLKPAEPTWFSLSNGNSGNVQVRTTGRTGYYEFWDTGAEWALLAAKGYKTPGGTSSQFLKADGSVDGNLYAKLTDVSNIADVYFNGQDIYSDYGHWVVGLIRIGDSSIGDKYISGEMIYRRSNGIYANGSVRFNLIKKYQTTSMFAGVFYNGYGVDPNQDAPRLCTFTYQGVKWGGLCWRSAASLNSIKTIIYDNSSTDTPFYVGYYNSQSGEVKNTEINNSISVLGSDIDIFPISSNGKFYTSSGRMDIHSAGNDWAYMRYTTDGRFYDIGLSSSRNPDSAMNGETGNFEIRPDGSSSNGIFVRYSNSSYGRLGVVSRSTQECSISYWNNAPTSNYPLWTVGAGIRNQYSFDWYYHNQGYKATLDSEGKLFVNVRVAGNPYCSLTIGDYDTGLSWVSDGVIGFRANARDVGFWGPFDGRLFNCYFREPTGHTYQTTSLMINGTSTIAPGIAFHQPGVTASVMLVNSNGDFNCRNSDNSGYKNIYAGNVIADAGFLHSRYNGIEVKIGAQNSSYVHITNNANKPYYFDHGVITSGGIDPYEHNKYTLGSSPKYWAGAYISKVYGGANWADHLSNHYIGGQQANPQTYFGQSIGLKVAMTGVNPDSYWGDTLWINGYGGTDVPSLCALHFSRGGKPLMYISTQTYNATSYGTLYSVWTAYNSNKSDAAWSCSTLNANGRVTCADVYSSGWLRTVGATGWYNETYAGGMYMVDGTWIRTYNGRKFYVDNAEVDAILTQGGFRSNGNSQVGLQIDGSESTRTIIYGKIGSNVNSVVARYAVNWYSEWARFDVHRGGGTDILKFSWKHNDTELMYLGMGGYFQVNGTIVSTGEVTAYSDIRLKTNIKPLDYKGRLAPKWFIKDNKPSIGFIAQEVQALYPELVKVNTSTIENYLSLNYGAITAVLSAQVNKVEDEVEVLKNRIRQLENEVALLKQKP